MLTFKLIYFVLEEVDSVSSPSDERSENKVFTVVAFFLRARIMREGSTNHSPPFFFVFFQVEISSHATTFHSFRPSPQWLSELTLGKHVTFNLLQAYTSCQTMHGTWQQKVHCPGGTNIPLTLEIISLGSMIVTDSFLRGKANKISN